MGENSVSSRTVSLTDEEWEEIGKAAERRGFGPRGRGRVMVVLAREDNERAAK